MKDSSVWRKLALSTLVGLIFGAGLVFPLIQQTKPDARRMVAVAIGAIGLTVGVVMVGVWTAFPGRSSSLRRLGITWGLMGAIGGLGILLWAAGFDWLMVLAGVFCIVLWRMGRRYLRKAIAESRNVGP